MTFGQTLKQLLTISGVKSAALAARLGYDTSYISRWISDIKLPSLKNNSRLFSQIAASIVEESDSTSREQLRQTFCPGGGDGELLKAIEEALASAFGDSRPGAVQPLTSHNAIYFPSGLYKDGYDIYIKAIARYAQETGSREIPCITAAPLKPYNNQNDAFWAAILSAPQILGKLHITLHQLIDSADFSANADSYCAAICTFSHYHEGIQYEFYEYSSVADIHSIQFIYIADQLSYQAVKNPLTGATETIVCDEPAVLSDRWYTVFKKLQMLPRLLTRQSCNSRHFEHFLYDYVMSGHLRYLLNVMQPVFISDELADEFMEQYVSGEGEELSPFYRNFNSLCSRAAKEVIIFRSALLEYIYSGTMLFCGRMLKIGREHRVRHLRQLLENLEQERCRLTILNDVNPLLNYRDMAVSLCLNRTSGFLTTSDSNDDYIVQISSRLAVDCFHQFFCHLQELESAFAMNGKEASDFIETGIGLI